MTALTTVTGYDRGVAYTVQIGGEGRTGLPDAGLVTYAAPPSVIGYVAARAGEPISLTPESETITGGLDTTSGILAALIADTEVIAVTGYVPDDVPTFGYSDGDVIH